MYKRNVNHKWHQSQCTKSLDQPGVISVLPFSSYRTHLYTHRKKSLQKLYTSKIKMVHKIYTHTHTQTQKNKHKQLSQASNTHAKSKYKNCMEKNCVYKSE